MLSIAGYGLFCRLEGRQPAREILYELTLGRHELRDLDAAAAAPGIEQAHPGTITRIGDSERVGHAQ